MGQAAGALLPVIRPAAAFGLASQGVEQLTREPPSQRLGGQIAGQIGSHLEDRDATRKAVEQGLGGLFGDGRDEAGGGGQWLAGRW